MFFQMCLHEVVLISPFSTTCELSGASQVALAVKNPPASAGDLRDPSSVPRSGRFPGAGHGNPLQYSCWRISWTEEPSRLQSRGLQRVGHNWSDWTHTISLSFGPGKWLNYCEPQFDFILNRLHKTYFSESVLSNGDDYMHAHFQNCIFSNWSTFVLQCCIGFCCTPFHYTFMHVLFLIAFTFFSLKLSDYNHLSLISIFVFPLLRSLLAQEPSGPRREE